MKAIKKMLLNFIRNKFDFLPLYQKVRMITIINTTSIPKIKFKNKIKFY